MSFFSSLKALFNSNEAKASAYPSEEYKGYTITPTPQREASQYRVCGLINKGEQEHLFFRADLLGSAEECANETLRKAKITIDQLGDSIFR